MPKIFKISINKQNFEQSEFQRSALVKSDENTTLCDVEEMRPYGHVKFVDYVMEGNKYVGAKFLCDYGHGFGSEADAVTLKPNEIYYFEHDGIWIDDEGCPEDYSLHYRISIELYE